MTFNDFRAYRQSWTPVLELKKWRERKILSQGRSEPQLPPPELMEDDKTLYSAGMFGICVLLAGLMLIAGCFTTPAHAYTKEEAIKAVIGEAEGESQRGKEAVACAIHYRGYLTGVYGLHAYRVTHHKYSKLTYIQAKQAVEMAEDQEYCEGLVNGAQYWEGTAFPMPNWAKSMTLVTIIGHQRFYRKDNA